ncbi:MAG: 3-oxoacyl-ACP reductase FabG [Gammaproteobacteria bacterium]|nr:3-oxoacyl-ACP reductase FabG [Gammaproteobacteria bacterium]
MTSQKKRALVTGGSGDIGSAISSRLAEDGFDLIIHANNHLERAENLAASLREQGHSAQSIAFDITDPDATTEAINGLIAEQPIQVVVNNAGIHDDAPMPGMKREQWQQVIDVSLNGFFNVTQPLLMSMMSTRWGRIINLSSISGIMGNRGQANYAAAKAGLHGATKSLARELASRGITVNAVAPGIISGKMTEGLFDNATISQMIPMKRTGTPEEVASLVAFLSSDEAAYISGQIISINGAMA